MNNNAMSMSMSMSMYDHLQPNNSIRSVRSSVQSLDDIQLSAKPHAFSGAVLNPKSARELTPKTVLTITHTLGVHALDNANQYPSSGPNPNSAESNSSYNTRSDAGASSTDNANANNNASSEAKVQYTVWITEAWRVLGWVEPSAALFWEMATMYHTLHVAARSIEVEETEIPATNSDGEATDHGSIQRTWSQSIPPILSCGSSASMDSVEKDKDKDKDKNRRDGGDRGGERMGSGSGPVLNSPVSHQGSTPGSGSNSPNRRGGVGDKKNPQNNKASNASAKELPVWLVGMFLLLHCEEEAFRRNVSGEDEQRFDALMAKQSAGSGFGEILKDGLGGKAVDFGMLLMHPSLHSRAQFLAGRLDNTNCTAYILRHLRKFLLLSCVPHNAEALMGIYSLAESESPHDAEYTDRQHPPSRKNGSPMMNPYLTIDADVLLRRHEDEHAEIGLNVRMTSDDLERLNLILQSPSGGPIDGPPLYISDVMPKEELAIYGGIPLEDVEREIRKHLEAELLIDPDENSQQEKDDVESVTKDMRKLNMGENKESKEDKEGRGMVHVHNDIDEESFNKELTYNKLRGSTILLKPNTPLHPSGRPISDSNPSGSLPNNGRLHDVHVSGCSDAHIYLLQPFEHATISVCTGCTIVVGAVAGLLQVVDCERTTITSAARRVLVSNCYDVTHNIFTPSPPLLVGDNRNCQFAPYNTYYDGLREDLLATGLAALLVSQEIVTDPLYGPALQCASNKWKQPVELAKMCDLLQAQSIAPRSTSPIPGSSPGADDKAFSKDTDDVIKGPSLLPASEFQVLFVPFIGEATMERRSREEANADEYTVHTASSEDNMSISSGPKHAGIGSMYCNNLADVLQLSPFQLPKEFERKALVKAERMKSLQNAIQTHLTPEQQLKLEEELNSGFRDWLVTSGNLRQVLDLVKMESKEG